MDAKEQVRKYWGRETCGAGHTTADKFSRRYFDEIERHRYAAEPEIRELAQFAHYSGQTILEVGVGAGTDFLQWARAGCHCCGVDLTEEAVEHTRRRLEVYGLKAEEVRVADTENLPYPDGKFDLVYSWGVIHHTPDTEKALSELIRVTRPGGRIKVMVYNRHSLVAFYLWLKYGLPRCQSVAAVLANRLESPGTKAFTVEEIQDILKRYPVRIWSIQTRVTGYDLLRGQPPLLRIGAYCLARLAGWDRVGWFMRVELEKL